MSTNPTLIPGLTYVPDYVTDAQEESLIEHVDQGDWLTDLKRLVQHYGYRYDYRARSVSGDSYLGPLPDWATEPAQKLLDDGFFLQSPDQLIVNAYDPGQGISAHVDCVPCFTDTIASVSLGSTCVMNFRNLETRETVPIFLESGSLVVMTGEARYDWTHAIHARQSDTWEGIPHVRERRISLTFRNVILND